MYRSALNMIGVQARFRHADHALQMESKASNLIKGMCRH